MRDSDAALGGNFVLFINDPLTKARYLLVLHSADYDSADWTRPDFANFLAAPSPPTRARPNAASAGCVQLASRDVPPIWGYEARANTASPSASDQGRLR